MCPTCSFPSHTRTTTSSPIPAMLDCFFEAEDGIRDYKVTGVQTCALPISDRVAGGDRSSRVRPVIAARTIGYRVAGFRSEERRVGKECRSRWSAYMHKINSIARIQNQENGSATQRRSLKPRSSRLHGSEER